MKASFELRLHFACEVTGYISDVYSGAIGRVSDGGIIDADGCESMIWELGSYQECVDLLDKARQLKAADFYMDYAEIIHREIYSWEEDGDVISECRH